MANGISKAYHDSAHQQRRILYDKCIHSMMHASQCKNCPRAACKTIKRLLQHSKNCKSKETCHHCRKLVALCCYHARKCQLKKCTIPLCPDIKRKYKEPKDVHIDTLFKAAIQM